MGNLKFIQHWFPQLGTYFKSIVFLQSPSRCFVRAKSIFPSEEVKGALLRAHTSFRMFCPSKQDFLFSIVFPNKSLSGFSVLFDFKGTQYQSQIETTRTNQITKLASFHHKLIDPIIVHRTLLITHHLVIFNPSPSSSLPPILALAT